MPYNPTTQQNPTHHPPNQNIPFGLYLPGTPKIHYKNKDTWLNNYLRSYICCCLYIQGRFVAVEGKWHIVSNREDALFSSYNIKSEMVLHQSLSSAGKGSIVAIHTSYFALEIVIISSIRLSTNCHVSRNPWEESLNK